MKFAGFDHPDLNLGFIDVALVARSCVKVLSCSSCGFTCATMHLQMCGHVMCDRCLVRPRPPPGTTVPEKPFYCSSCDLRVLAMPVKIQEEFVLKLQCHCPRCSIEMKVAELSNHLDVCIDLPKEEPDDKESLKEQFPIRDDEPGRPPEVKQGLQIRVLREELIGKLCSIQNLTNEEVTKVCTDLVKAKQELTDSLKAFFPTVLDVTLRKATSPAVDIMSSSMNINGHILRFVKEGTNVLLRVEVSPPAATENVRRKIVTIKHEASNYTREQTIELKSGSVVTFESCDLMDFTATFTDATE